MIDRRSLLVITASSPALAASLPLLTDAVWHDCATWPRDSQGWSGEELAAPYDRLPARAKETVRSQVWDLSRRSAGLSIGFRTDAKTFRLRYPRDCGAAGDVAHARDRR